MLQWHGGDEMDLKSLNAFVVIAETGSISLAAGRLNIVQPALSRQIARLEGDLGVTLFRRHGRGVELTADGQRILDHARVVLRDLAALRDEAARRNFPAGEVAFGTPTTVAEVLIAPVIESCARQWPEVKLRAVTGYSGHVQGWLQSGTLDLGVIYDTGKALAGIRTSPLLVENLFLVEPPEAPARDTATLEEAAALRLILPNPVHGLRILIDMVAARQGIAIAPVVETDALAAQIDLVRRGFGATILPRVSVFRDLREGRLRATPLERPGITRTLMLATPDDRPLSGATRAVAAEIRAEVTRLAATGLWPHVALPGDADGDMPKWHI